MFTVNAANMHTLLYAALVHDGRMSEKGDTLQDMLAEAEATARLSGLPESHLLREMLVIEVERKEALFDASYGDAARKQARK